MINVEVVKNGTENSTSLIRRFTKRMQGSGILPRMRKNRFYTRPASQFLKQKRAVRKIERREKYEEMVKQGKVVERTHRRR
ncbi:MAG: 30S ribosomal protein S21 [Candidatus Pacebacteria bacterium]|jgi:ribosomal protein S21|nr:hypothetical protein [bacterium]MDP6527743.1 30S ribosomal protein S21 [Candidatus Paceibacterota bacterium]|tara:strand:- start:22674 stop:22916 length:243 start_codon:yes stop_codon:yes gene_type:complete